MRGPVAAVGAGPQTTSTRSTSVLPECAASRYQSGHGVSLLSGSPRGPMSATFGRPGSPIPERFVRPAASSWIGATATPSRPRRSSVKTSVAQSGGPPPIAVSPSESASRCAPR